MPRRTIGLHAESYYHVYNRGVNRERIFFEPENYAFFLRRLRKYLAPDIVRVLAYCLMPNHYHLLLFVQEEGFDKAMQALGVSYAKAINACYRRVGPLFQGRFRAKPVDKEEYLLHLSRYIHLSPVMGGLVGKPEEWAYSSYQEYIGSRRDPWLWTERILSQGTPGFFQETG